MSDMVKLVIAAGAALVVGFIIGFAIGSAGKGDLEAAAATAKQVKETTQAALKQERAELDKQKKKTRRNKLLRKTKEHLLRALIELYASNYGLASQHMGNARNRLKAARKHLSKKHSKRVEDIFEKMANIQTLVMRLDANARKYLQDLVSELERIPGAR